MVNKINESSAQVTPNPERPISFPQFCVSFLWDLFFFYSKFLNFELIKLRKIPQNSR